MDMANNMSSAARRAFPSAFHVIDCSHVVRLALGVLQHVRIKHRWEELDTENKAIEACRKKGKRFTAKNLVNADTPKELLARCRFIIAKKPVEWTESKKLRASLLFDLYPDLKRLTTMCYCLEVYMNPMIKRRLQRELPIGLTKRKNWLLKSLTLFRILSGTISIISLTSLLGVTLMPMLSSFNSEIKLFRANQRGVVDNDFFLFRLVKLFA